MSEEQHQSKMENLGLQTMTLSDGTTAYVQQDARESITFEDGQSVALEDGTMAFIHHVPKEGYDPNTLEVIQLEDGSTAFIHCPVSLATSSTILAVQADVQMEGLAVEKKNVAFDAGTITVLKEYATQLLRRREGSLISEAKRYLEGNAVKEASAKECQPPLLLACLESPLLGLPCQGCQEEEVQINRKGPLVASRGHHCGYKGCGRLYSTAHHLRVHERVHTGVRPYRCDFSTCGKAFATGYSLKNHVRIHTGEKPYKCPEDVCNKAFKTSGDLQKHIRTHTGERPFNCPFEGCGRSFTTSNIRKVHIRTHTGERPYMCPEPNCRRGFTSATNYKNHMRIHTGEKPYACMVPGCGKCFTEYSSLYKHHVVHTHCKPYTCSTCGKTYRQTSTLAMHKRTTHGELEATEESEQALYEQQMKDAAVKDSLKFQHVTLVKVKTEEGEDSKPVAVEVVSQDGTKQLEEQQSPEDAVIMTTTATHQKSTTLTTATSNDGC